MTVDDDINAVRSLLGNANPVTDTAISAPPPPPLRTLGQSGGYSPSNDPKFGRRVRLRLAVAAVAAVAAAIVGVVVVRSDSTQPSTNAAVLAAYTTTADAGTTRAAFTITADGNTVTGEGVGNFATGEATGTATLPPPIGEVSFVSTGQIIYVQLPESFRNLVGGKPWAQLPAADLVQLENLVLGQVGLSTPFNPADVLGYIRGVSGEVTDLGPDTVRGEETTRYRARIELAKVAAQAGLSDATDVELTLPADLWIDTEGRLRKLTMSLTSPISVTATFELWDFGTTVEATPPPPDQVADISSLISGFFGHD